MLSMYFILLSAVISLGVLKYVTVHINDQSMCERVNDQSMCERVLFSQSTVTHLGAENQPFL